MMRTNNSHVLDCKMDDPVTHYINSHHASEPIHVDASNLALNIHDDSTGRVVTLMHPGPNFSSQLCRQVSMGEQVGESQWGDELLDPDGKFAALVAHLAQHSRTSHHLPAHHKVPPIRGDIESVILDGQLRMLNNHASLDHTADSIIVEVPPLPALPPLQEMKRSQDTDWFNKKTSLKDNSPILQTNGAALELNPGLSPIQKQQNKKSLPHKKRITKKLIKRNTGRITPQHEMEMNVSDEVHQEEILPDNFVPDVHQEQLPEDTHHIAHEVNEVRSVFICQICGDYYGEEQFKFFQHLKQHYEPPGTIIIENSVPDLGIDKMTNTCIVDNATLPDSIVELTLDNTVPKTIYQTIDKHILYTSSDKTLNYTSNKVQYSMASIHDKDPHIPTSEEKQDLYESFDLYACTKCNKPFKKQKQCEAHIKEVHSKCEVMSEFSEPEDLMEGIHVSVEEGGEGYEQALLLPQLTVENGHVHRESARQWYMRGSVPACGEDVYCSVCPASSVPPAPPAPPPPQSHTQTHLQTHPQTHPQSHLQTHPQTHSQSHTQTQTHPQTHPLSQTHPQTHTQPQPQLLRDHLKEEVLQRIFETEVSNTDDQSNFNDTMMIEDPEIPQDPELHDNIKKTEELNGKKKATKRFECVQCGRVFVHRNSLLYHVMSHNGKQHKCRECGKGFYTAGALKIHKRVHNDDRPWKCDECGKEFRQKSDLKYHQTSIHSNQKHFKCEFCNKEFARKYSLSVHRRIHTGEKNYKCDYCNKSFRASSYRLSHMRVHTGDRPHKCDECEKCFRVAGDLKRHKLTHEKLRKGLEGDRPHKCDECDKCFRVAADLKRHKLTHDKCRNRFEEQKKHKDKDLSTSTNDSDVNEQEAMKTVKKQIIESSKVNVLKNSRIDKKPKANKKNQIKKLGAPNVTVSDVYQKDDGEFKTNNEYENPELYNVKQNTYKFKEVFTDSDYNKKDCYNEHRVIEEYKTNHKEDKDFATLRPMLRGSVCDVEEKPVIRESTDGKLTVYTHVERTKDYGTIVSNTQNFNDIRSIARDVVREVRSDSLHGEMNEPGFIERLTAIYNISTV